MVILRVFSHARPTVLHALCQIAPFLTTHCYGHWYPAFRITLADNPPDDPEGSYALPNGLYNPSLLKDLTLLNFGSTQPAVTAVNTVAVESAALGTNGSNDGSSAGTVTAPTFSISDFLVPALHTKVWDDWQAADDFT